MKENKETKQEKLRQERIRLQTEQENFRVEGRKFDRFTAETSELHQQEKRIHLDLLETFYGEKEQYFFEDCLEECQREERKNRELAHEGREESKRKERQLEEELLTLAYQEKREREEEAETYG